MRLFKVKNLPLTKIQIDICDFILRQENNVDAYSISYKEFPDIESNVFEPCTSFLYKENLITSANLLKFTIKGAKYRKKGIAKYIGHVRRNEFFNMPILKFWLLLIPILISLTYNVITYMNNNKINAERIRYKKQYEYIDSTLNQQNKELYNLAVLDSVNKVTFDSVFDIIKLHNNSVKNE